MPRLSHSQDGRAKPSTIAIALPEAMLFISGIDNDLDLRSKVVSEAVRAFLNGEASSDTGFQPDQPLYRRTVEVHLSPDLIEALDDWIAQERWRPRAHAVEQAMMHYLNPTRGETSS